MRIKNTSTTASVIILIVIVVIVGYIYLQKETPQDVQSTTNTPNSEDISSTEQPEQLTPDAKKPDWTIDQLAQLSQIDQIDFIARNKAAVESLIVHNFSQFRQHADVLSNYLIVLVGDRPDLQISMYEETMTTYKTFPLTEDGAPYVSVTAHISPDLPEGFFIYNDRLGSGAYNLTNFAYTFAVTNQGIQAKFVTFVDINTEKNIPSLVTQDFFAYQTLLYDTNTHMFVVYGMRPFGRYPCIESRHYTMEKDRAILHHTQILSICLERGLESFEHSATSTWDLDEELDFDRHTVTYTTPPDLYKKALEL